MNIQQINATDHLLLHCTNVIDELSFSKIANYLSRIVNDKGMTVDCSTTDKVNYMALHKIFSSIEKILYEHNSKVVKMTGFVVGKNNTAGQCWHTHDKQFIGDPIDFRSPNSYVVIFYLHKECDNIFGRSLKVGDCENNLIHSFNCDSNSCVIHSASLSHSVEWINLQVPVEDSNMESIVMYSHWVEVENNDTSSN
jgi:hypothetical protein